MLPSNRNQSIHIQCQSIDSFLYEGSISKNGLIVLLIVNFYLKKQILTCKNLTLQLYAKYLKNTCERFHFLKKITFQGLFQELRQSVSLFKFVRTLS